MKTHLSVILSFAAGLAQAETTKKPNIILFFVDDMGWQDTSVPFYSEKTSQNKFFQTPNMERLAAKGVKFTQAYGCPLSSPSRASLLTGCNVTEHHVSNVGGGPNSASKGGMRPNGGAMGQGKGGMRPSGAGMGQGKGSMRPNGGGMGQGKGGMRPNSGAMAQGKGLNNPSRQTPSLGVQKWNEFGITVGDASDKSFLCTTLPQVLKAGGYTTMIVGKAHFGRNDSAVDPIKLGFDANIGGSAAASPASYLGTENFASNEGRANKNVPHLEAYHGQDIFLTEALTLEAIKLMDAAVKKQTPFFLYFSQFAVHTPHDKDKRFYDKYIQAGASDAEACYASLVEGMDKSLGDVMDYLDEAGIADNTIILFMSDNGGAGRGISKGTDSEPGANAPLRGTKGSLYEGGIREPMITYVPNVSQAGTTNSSTVIIEDFFPSIVELAQSNNAVKTIQPIQSASFIKALAGEHINDDRPFFWHYPHVRGNGGSAKGTACSAIRLGNMKLMHFYQSGQSELYNLDADISEQHNLIGTKPEYDDIAKKLEKILSDKLRKECSPLPIITATGKVCNYPDGQPYSPEATPTLP